MSLTLLLLSLAANQAGKVEVLMRADASAPKRASLCPRACRHVKPTPLAWLRGTAQFSSLSPQKCLHMRGAQIGHLLDTHGECRQRIRSPQRHCRPEGGTAGREHSRFRVAPAVAGIPTPPAREVCRFLPARARSVKKICRVEWR